MIRPATPADRDIVYEICLLTGADGADASDLYDDCDLLGDVWAGPYLALEPALAFVLVDEVGVAGYVLGALDTGAFEARCEREWWPSARLRHPLPGRGRGAFETGWIHDPPPTPTSITDRFPSHLHIDLLPRTWGTGQAAQLLAALLAALREQGSIGVHLGVSAGNLRAIGFYRKHGFGELDDESDDTTLMMGLALDSNGGATTMRAW